MANARWVAAAVKKHLEGWGVPGMTLELPRPLAAFFAQSDADAAAQLFRLENPSAATVARARTANASVRAELARTKRYPMATLYAHATTAAVLPLILRTANYDAMFHLSDAHDTPTLGLADMTRIDAKAHRVTVKEVATNANAGFGGVALLYDPARLDAQCLAPARGTEYNNHWTYAIALPNAALAAIQLLEPLDAKTLKVIQKAAAHLSIPVVDTHGKECP